MLVPNEDVLIFLVLIEILHHECRLYMPRNQVHQHDDPLHCAIQNVD